MNGGSQAMEGLFEAAGAGQCCQVIVETFLQAVELTLGILQLGHGLQLGRQTCLSFGPGRLLFVSRALHLAHQLFEMLYEGL